MNAAKKLNLEEQVYLMNLRDKVADTVMDTLTSMDLPDDVYHQHILASCLLAVASLLAVGTAECNEAQFLAIAKDNFSQARALLTTEPSAVVLQ